MVQQTENLAKTLEAAGNPPQQQEDPAAKILDFKFSIREATMIVNKLNTATFSGLGEASAAVQIFTKIQATVAMQNRIQQQQQPPQPAKTVAFKPPVTEEASTPVSKKQPEPVVEEDEPSVNTNAPMSPVSEAKAPTPSADDDTPPPEDAGIFSVIDKRGDV